MRNPATDSSKTVAVFINDFDQEFADALVKLSKKLGRKLTGVIILDKVVKAEKRNSPDVKGLFEQIVCDFSDDTSLRSVAKKLEDSLLLVTCSGERNQPYLKRLLPHVPGIFGPTESSLDWATHKAKMRDQLRGYNPALVPDVQHITKNSEQEIRKVLNNLVFPVIVKPTGLAASMLVTKAHNESELRKALKQGFSVIRDVYDRDCGRGEPGFIVEEFIEGDMHSVDVYVNQAGTVWPLPLLRSTIAQTVGKEGFYICQDDSELTIPQKQIAEGHSAAIGAIHALGLRSCVAHIELFHTRNGWKIVELGPRAGGLRQDIYAASQGIDHAYNELLVKIGLPPEMPKKPKAYITTVKVYPEQEGIITAIEGVEAARALSSMYSMRVQAKPGDTALFSNNGGKIIVRCVLSNTDVDQLDKDTRLVWSLIRVATKGQV